MNTLKKDIDKFLNNLFADFNPKQRQVMEGRFGLRNGVCSTLQKIGDKLGVTRERVRQIEEQGIQKLKPRIQKDAREFLEGAGTHLIRTGGVRRDDYFVSDLRYIFGLNPIKTKYLPRKIHFLLLVGGTPFYERENERMYAFWYADEASKNRFFNFVKKMTKFLESKDKKEILEKRAVLTECRDISSCHFLAIPKHFGINVFGDFGLRSWPEIEPKTVRDKAYLVLKKGGKPIHFSDIAKYINHFGIDKKPAHIQTVHNELIKDERFVLVGRGIYALQEHGFESGTVKEVITKLLKQRGPLKSNEIIRLVGEQRILKKNTILLNLQNRRYFKRLEDGRYHIREI